MENERSQYTDETLLHLREDDPNIRCFQENKGTKVSVNRKCGNNIKCSDVRYQSCRKNVHVGCVVNCNLKKITETVNENTGGQRWILGKILIFEEQFISNIRKVIKQFVGECFIGAGIGEHAKYMGKINGKKYNDLSDEEKAMTDWYTEGLRTKIEEIEEMPKSVEKGKNIGQFGAKNLISKLAVQHIQFIANKLNNPKKLQMLFRLSKNQFKATTFHCVNIEDTFVNARTDFWKIIAGFIRHKWEPTNKSVSGQSKDAFLLQVDLTQKMAHRKGRLICCGADQGPYSGDPDLRIGGNCNTTANHADFPNSYNFEGPNKYTNASRLTAHSRERPNHRILELWSAKCPK